ncbi:MAG: MerR family DNA-binding transcriptional regulator [Beijerinckiaceae bacterium]|nr:MerR family DNA-binding transcriptional regulator [Beijerinckiaceae bacterium]
MIRQAKTRDAKLPIAAVSEPSPQARIVPEGAPSRKAKRDEQALEADDRFLTVTEIAKELGVTARTLRFYEDKNLISPRRVASTRVYTNRERARMILILRGKRLGFSLREIKEYLDLYDADPTRITQTKVLLKKIEVRTKQLEEQRVAVDQALKGLKELEIDALAVLEWAERRGAEEKPRPGPGRARHNSLQNVATVSAAPAVDHQEPKL